jgi:transcriptional regulator with XRE-family HTH domain
MRPKRKPKTPKTPGSLRQVLAGNVSAAMARAFPSEGDKVKVLAKKSGASRSTVQRVVNGEYGATIDTIEALAKALRVPVHQLLKKR